MTDLDSALGDLVVANRILANENVVDAYGHVSIRHPGDPERYFLSCSRSPELVSRADIMEFRLDGTALDSDTRSPYLERFIHGGVYERNPGVMAVVHSHAEDVLPYSITDEPLRPVIHSAGLMGAKVPVWDIADRFGDTSLLVVNMDQGRDLAGVLDAHRVVLMRGHGFSAAARIAIRGGAALGDAPPERARPDHRASIRPRQGAVRGRDRQAARHEPRRA